MSFERELDFKVGQRPLPQALGDGAGLDAGVGRARAALQRALVPVLPPEGRARASADRAGRPGGGDVPAAVGAGGRPPTCRAALAPGSRTISRPCPSRPMAGSCRTSGCRGCRPRGGWGSTYEEVPVTLGDGEVVTLRRPSYAVVGPRLRAAEPGRAALAAGGAADDRARAARGGAGGGHPGAGRSRRRRRRRHQRAAEPGLVGGGRRGRCSGASGCKAGQPTIRDQAAAAFSGDIGISTPLHPDGWGDCTEAQAVCRAQPDGGAPEADDTVLDLVTFYSRNLAVPARRDPGDPQVLAGKRVFYEAGCAGLPPAEVRHRPAGRPAGAELPADLALHRPAAARHGRGAGRPPAGGAWRRARVADGAALGDRADRDGDRAGELPARRAGADAARGGALARRRGAGGARPRSWRCRRPSGMR